MKKKLSGPKLRKKLIRELDALVAQIVKSRDLVCVICPPQAPKDTVMDCGHLFSRRYHSTRWELLNTHTQCRYHNSLHRFDTHPYNSWFIQKYGKDKWDALYKQAHTPHQFKTWELEELKEKLTLMI
mgnify:CR=1 FL=1